MVAYATDRSRHNQAGPSGLFDERCATQAHAARRTRATQSRHVAQTSDGRPTCHHSASLHSDKERSWRTDQSHCAALSDHVVRHRNNAAVTVLHADLAHRGSQGVAVNSSLVDVVGIGLCCALSIYLVMSFQVALRLDFTWLRGADDGGRVCSGLAFYMENRMEKKLFPQGYLVSRGATRARE